MKALARGKFYLYRISFLISLLSILFGVQINFAQSGCTDPLADNYDPQATENNGNCVYKDTVVAPESSKELSEKLKETSGLIFWNDHLITHNDSGDNVLYSLDPDSGTIEVEYELSGTTNTDWEAIAQDKDYIYVGDVGNNASGNRRDLNILRVSKKSLQNENPQVEKIEFSYEDQTDFTKKEANKNDFDCEAVFITKDRIFLLTKQWVSQQTKIYTLPKTPGKHIAKLKNNLPVGGLVTGANLLNDKKLLVLSGYSPTLLPFLYLVYDYENFDFENANKRKLQLELPFTQVEALTTTDGLIYYLTNEYFSRPPFVNSVQKLHNINLKDYLGQYLADKKLGIIETDKLPKLKVFPVPARNFVTLASSRADFKVNYEIFSPQGKSLKKGLFNSSNNRISIGHFSEGIYYLKLEDKKEILKIIKR